MKVETSVLNAGDDIQEVILVLTLISFAVCLDHSIFHLFIPYVDNGGYVVCYLSNYSNLGILKFSYFS